MVLTNKQTFLGFNSNLRSKIPFWNNLKVNDIIEISLNLNTVEMSSKSNGRTYVPTLLINNVNQSTKISITLRRAILTLKKCNFKELEDV